MELVYPMLAFFPTSCKHCNRFIWFHIVYKMPWFMRDAYGYGPFDNEAHCWWCHREIKREDKDSECYLCAWGEISRKAYNDIRC